MKQLNQIDESALETKRRCSMPEQNETDLLLSQRSTMSEPIARPETVSFNLFCNKIVCFKF